MGEAMSELFVAGVCVMSNAPAMLWDPRVENTATIPRVLASALPRGTDHDYRTLYVTWWEKVDDGEWMHKKAVRRPSKFRRHR